MSGWKTIAGALIIAAGAILRYNGYNELAEATLTVGAALGLIGIGHKLDKQTPTEQPYSVRRDGGK